MATSEHVRTLPTRGSRRRRHPLVVLLGLVLAAALITGCTRLTAVAGDEAQPVRSVSTTGDPTSTTSSARQAVAGAAISATRADDTAATSASAARTRAKVASGEVLEVTARIAEASIEPGTCGTVAYTPDTASTVEVGDLCVPAEATRSTVIVLVHGGGGTGGSRTDLAAWQQAYSDRGYTTFSIDYRLTDADTDTRVWPEPEQDVKAAIQFVRLAGSVLGTEQVVVQGHSAGARLGGVVLTTPDDPAFQGSELWTEVSDAVDGFVGFYGYYDGFQFEWDAYYGIGAERPVASRADANAANASGPALLITGDADDMVDPTESRDFAAALDAAGGDGTAIELDGRNHGFDQLDLQLTDDGHQMVDRIEWWITDHLETSPATP